MAEFLFRECIKLIGDVCVGCGKFVVVIRDRLIELSDDFFGQREFGHDLFAVFFLSYFFLQGFLDASVKCFDGGNV